MCNSSKVSTTIKDVSRKTCDNRALHTGNLTAMKTREAFFAFRGKETARWAWSTENWHKIFHRRDAWCTSNLKATNTSEEKSGLIQKLVHVRSEVACRENLSKFKQNSGVLAFPCDYESANEEFRDSMTHHKAHREPDSDPLHRCTANVLFFSYDLSTDSGVRVFPCDCGSGRWNRKEINDAHSSTSRNGRFRPKCPKKLSDKFSQSIPGG